ncbi:MAG TPA: GspH/FimT family pseudopilin [Candidatus Polarisedimenticolaceae bacterium]
MNPRVRSTSRGFSAAELLIVIAIIGLLVAVAVPLVNNQVRQAKARGAADAMGVDLRAARMLAVTKQQDIPFVLEVDPVNAYRYTGNDGKVRRFVLPVGVRILGSSTPTTITFRPNGSIAAQATTVVEIAMSGSATAKETYTIVTSTAGIPKTTKTRTN